MTTKAILIADDEAIMRRNLSEILTEEGFTIIEASDGREAVETAGTVHPPVMLLDINMPAMDGLTALREIKRLAPQTSVIVFTAYGTSERAIEAMKIGAFDYIEKPFDLEELLQSIRRALSHNALLHELQELRLQVSHRSDTEAPEELIGASPSMQEIFKLIGRVAPTDTPVLIEGESGTGKELVANAIQRHSNRKDKPFIKVNCGALPEPLLESEMFGHEKGAFTGAIAQRQGRFEIANGGTIFLDEINNMPPSLQMKLLRVLQQKTFERVGGKQTLTVDVRVIAASNKDLAAEIKAGNFRDDLLYRLNVIHIKVPPLRERQQDIPAMVDHFVRKHRGGKPVMVSPAVMETLRSYSWPGNVRELENVIQRAIVLAEGNILTLDHLPLTLRAEGDLLPKEMLWREGVPFRKIIEDVERHLILRALNQTQWNRTQAAKLLQIHRRLLFSKIKQYRLRPDPHAS